MEYLCISISITILQSMIVAEKESVFPLFNKRIFALKTSLLEIYCLVLPGIQFYRTIFSLGIIGGEHYTVSISLLTAEESGEIKT